MKKLILLICIVLSYLFLTAQTIDEFTATKVATNFISSLDIKKHPYDKQSIRYSLQNVEMESGSKLFYHFDLGSQPGFVLISANKVSSPVLAFSTESDLLKIDRSIGSKFFLDLYKAEILAAIEQKVEPTPEITAEWEKYSHPVKNIFRGVLPLLSTTWGQEEFYNALCPEDSLGPAGHASAGSVAVAMAQIFNYFKYPPIGIGKNTYNHSIYGILYANFENYPYDYSNMPDVLTNYNSDVAYLIYQCGIGVNMDFGPTVSEANNIGILKGLMDYFNFPNAQVKEKASFLSDVWEDLLKDELNLDRPVLYGGFDSVGTNGHKFVCDGYDNDFFHFNFGWEGTHDGYYQLDAIEQPNSFDFSYFQDAVFNVFPIDPLAEFKATGRYIKSGDSTSFIDLSYSTNNIVSWSWEFPGGIPATSNQQNPGPIIYPLPGKYQVKLTIEDDSPATDDETKINYIHVYPKVINYVEAPDGVHPMIYGKCSFTPEWDSADYWINKENGKRGAICRQYQEDWVAESEKDISAAVYPGITLFEMHDFWDADSYECTDFNKFGWRVDPTPTNPHFALTAWVFDTACNETDDWQWLHNEMAEGLFESRLRNQSGDDLFDDRGFIVRLDNDPQTDVQWLPGDPEPGDLTWVWKDYHGFYGRFNFNETSRLFQVPWVNDYMSVMNKMPGAGAPNEVYEFALHGGIGGADSSAYQPCSHTFRYIDHYDPHLGCGTTGCPVYAYINVIDGPGHIGNPNVPWPHGGGGGVNPFGNHQQGWPGRPAVFPGISNIGLLTQSNIGVAGGNFIFEITDDDGWLTEPILIQDYFDPQDKKVIRYDFDVPEEVESGTYNRFNVHVMAEDNPEKMDSYHIDHIVSPPLNHFIWRPEGVSPASSSAIGEGLLSMGQSVDMGENLPEIDQLIAYDIVWACLGTHPYYYELWPDSPEFNILFGYLQNGGSLYLESGNFWSGNMNPLKEIFNIHAESIATEGIQQVIGYQFLLGMDFITDPDMPAISTDKIEISSVNINTTPGCYGSILLFNNRDDAYSLMIYNDWAEDYGCRTIGSSFELGSLLDNSISEYTKNDVLNRLVYLSMPAILHPDTVLNLYAEVSSGTLYASESNSYFGFCESPVDYWNWTFEGADPWHSPEQFPEEIYYYLPGVYDVKLTAKNAYARGEIVIEDALEVFEMIPDEWVHEIYDVYCTITIPLEANPSINGIPLHPGDLIGAFCLGDARNDICAGYVIWNGNEDVDMIVNADIPFTPEKDGYVDGDDINFRIYSIVEGQTYHAEGLTSNGDLATFYKGDQILLGSLNAVFDQEFYLFENWQGFSSYIVPKQVDIPAVFEPCGDNVIYFGNLDDIWWPSEDINTFTSWDKFSGYKIKMAQPCDLQIRGYIDLKSTCVLLSEGWNIFPVLSSDPIWAEDVFLSLDSVEVAVAVAGNGVYWPRYGINNLNYLWPGKSYWLYTNVPDFLDFGQSALKSNQPEDIKYQELFAVNPWNPVLPTPLQHTIGIGREALANFKAGDMLGAITETGYCAGVIEFTEASTPAGFNVFGNDPLTAEKDGFDEGETLSFQLHRAQANETINLTPVYVQTEETVEFRDKGLTMIAGFKEAPSQILVQEQSNIKIYPNPSNGIFNIEGVITDVGVSIFNAFGKEVLNKELTLPEKVDLAGQPKGVYFIRISTDKGSYFSKLVVN